MKGNSMKDASYTKARVGRRHHLLRPVVGAKKGAAFRAVAVFDDEAELNAVLALIERAQNPVLAVTEVA